MLPLAGLQPAEALAASVAFGLMFLTSVLPGLVLVAATSTPRPLKS
jgi:hypothetical protein